MEWLAILLHIDAVAFGYVLENEHGMYAYELGERRVVPAFRSLANAAAFVRDVDQTARVVSSEQHELAPLRAFAAGDSDAAPAGAFDTWVVLDEIAWAARRCAGVAPRPCVGAHRGSLRRGAAGRARRVGRSAQAGHLGAHPS